MEFEQPPPRAPRADRAPMMTAVFGPRGGQPSGPVFARYAGFVSRTMAMVIDLLLISAILLVSGFALDFFVSTSGITWLVSLLVGRFAWFQTVIDGVNSPAFLLIVVLGTAFVYFALLFALGGATIGKYIMGLRVVTAEGRRLRPLQAVIRALAYAPSALCLYFGFLAVLTDDRRRGWHDRLARTAVVYKWQARPDEAFIRAVAEELD